MKKKTARFIESHDPNGKILVAQSKQISMSFFRCGIGIQATSYQSHGKNTHTKCINSCTSMCILCRYLFNHLIIVDKKDSKE